MYYINSYLILHWNLLGVYLEALGKFGKAKPTLMSNSSQDEYIVPSGILEVWYCIICTKLINIHTSVFAVRFIDKVIGTVNIL